MNRGLEWEDKDKHISRFWETQSINQPSSILQQQPIYEEINELEIKQ